MHMHGIQSNCWLRKDRIEKCGGFSEKIQRKGNSQPLGNIYCTTRVEDGMEVLQKIRNEGNKIKISKRHLHSQVFAGLFTIAKIHNLHAHQLVKQSVVQPQKK